MSILAVSVALGSMVAGLFGTAQHSSQHGSQHTQLAAHTARSTAHSSQHAEHTHTLSLTLTLTHTNTHTRTLTRTGMNLRNNVEDHANWFKGVVALTSLGVGVFAIASYLYFRCTGVV